MTSARSPTKSPSAEIRSCMNSLMGEASLYQENSIDDDELDNQELLQAAYLARGPAAAWLAAAAVSRSRGNLHGKANSCRQELTQLKPGLKITMIFRFPNLCISFF